MEDQEIQAARDKLAARFNNAAQIGGKGKRHRWEALPPQKYSLNSPVNLTYNASLFSHRHPEKKEEACYRADC